MYGYLLLAVLALGAIQTSDGAPVGSRTRTVSFVDADFEPTNTSQCQQNQLLGILVETIFNFTDNFYAIRNAFQPQPGVHKICIPIAYDIICANQSDHDDQDYIINCTTGYQQSIIWTEFDTTDTAGNIVFSFASSGFSVFGFDWAGACDTESSTILHIELSSTTSLLCNSTDQVELLQALLYITTLVSVNNSNN